MKKSQNFTKNEHTSLTRSRSLCGHKFFCRLKGGELREDTKNRLRMRLLQNLGNTKEKV